MRKLINRAIKHFFRPTILKEKSVTRYDAVCPACLSLNKKITENDGIWPVDEICKHCGVQISYDAGAFMSDASKLNDYYAAVRHAWLANGEKRLNKSKLNEILVRPEFRPLEK